jgi:hypothetical protein
MRSMGWKDRTGTVNNQTEYGQKLVERRGRLGANHLAARGNDGFIRNIAIDGADGQLDGPLGDLRLDPGVGVGACAEQEHAGVKRGVA